MLQPVCNDNVYKNQNDSNLTFGETNKTDVESKPDVMALPYEIYNKIFSYLFGVDRNNVRFLNKHIYNGQLSECKKQQFTHLFLSILKVSENLQFKENPPVHAGNRNQVEPLQEERIDFDREGLDPSIAEFMETNVFSQKKVDFFRIYYGNFQEINFRSYSQLNEHINMVKSHFASNFMNQPMDWKRSIKNLDDALDKEGNFLNKREVRRFMRQVKAWRQERETRIQIINVDQQNPNSGRDHLDRQLFKIFLEWIHDNDPLHPDYQLQKEHAIRIAKKINLTFFLKKIEAILKDESQGACSLLEEIVRGYAIPAIEDLNKNPFKTHVKKQQQKERLEIALAKGLSLNVKKIDKVLEIMQIHNLKIARFDVWFEIIELVIYFLVDNDEVEEAINLVHRNQDPRSSEPLRSYLAQTISRNTNSSINIKEKLIFLIQNNRCDPILARRIGDQYQTKGRFIDSFDIFNSIPTYESRETKLFEFLVENLESSEIKKNIEQLKSTFNTAFIQPNDRTPEVYMHIENKIMEYLKKLDILRLERLMSETAKIHHDLDFCSFSCSLKNLIESLSRPVYPDAERKPEPTSPPPLKKRCL